MKDYRGNTKEGLTVYGDNVTLYHPEKTVCIAQEGTDQDWRNTKFIPVIPETVVKYTGVKDKNDKMIFEGDIATSEIIITGSKNGYRGNYKATLRSEIFYNKENCRYEMRAMNVECGPEIRWALFDLEKEHTCYIPKSIEVIGNKFDNPELIK